MKYTVFAVIVAVTSCLYAPGSAQRKKQRDQALSDLAQVRQQVLQKDEQLKQKEEEILYLRNIIVQMSVFHTDKLQKK